MKSERYIASARSVALLLVVCTIAAMHISVQNFNLSVRLNRARNAIAEWFAHDMILENARDFISFEEGDKSFFPKQKHYERLGHVKIDIDDASVIVAISPNIPGIDNAEPGLYPYIYNSWPWSRRIPLPATKSNTQLGTVMAVLKNELDKGGKTDSTKVDGASRSMVLTTEKWKSARQLKEIAASLGIPDVPKKPSGKAEGYTTFEENDQSLLLFWSIQKAFYEYRVHVPVINQDLGIVPALWALAFLSYALATTIQNKLQTVLQFSKSLDHGPWLIIDAKSGPVLYLCYIWIVLISTAPLLCVIALFTALVAPIRLDGFTASGTYYFLSFSALLFISFLCTHLSQEIYKDLRSLRRKFHVEAICDQRSCQNVENNCKPDNKGVD